MRLQRSRDASDVVLRKPSSGLPSERERPYVVGWYDPEEAFGGIHREAFRSPEHAAKRAQYLTSQGKVTFAEEVGQPALAPWKETTLPAAGISRVKHRLTEHLPFLVIYTTDKGPLSRSFETEAKAKQWALDFTDRKGYTTAVYALTREGKKLPLGYYKPNDGVPVAQDPVAAKAEADAKAAPATAVVPTVTPPPAVAKANKRLHGPNGERWLLTWQQAEPAEHERWFQDKEQASRVAEKLVARQDVIWATVKDMKASRYGDVVLNLEPSVVSHREPERGSFTPNLLDTSRLSPTGIPLVRGKRLGHGSPPKKYRRMGARHPGDYAYPERFMFPLYFRDASGKLIVSKSRRHVANAKTRFSTYKHRYPMAIRQQIAGNINKAARRVGLAADVRP